MTREKKAVLQHLDKSLREYSLEVDRSELSAASKAMYVDFATCFVRWMEGKFQPGIRLNPWKRQSD